MSGNRGKGGGYNRRSGNKRRDRESWQETPVPENNLGGGFRGGRNDKSRGSGYDRPKWTSAAVPVEPLPVWDCPWCGKPIKDIVSAVWDRNSGSPVHFDCIIARIAGDELLEEGDSVTYIGGGRFGVVHINNPRELRSFKIKKIFEWEDKDNRAAWRKTMADHYSVT